MKIVILRPLLILLVILQNSYIYAGAMKLTEEVVPAGERLDKLIMERIERSFTSNSIMPAILDMETQIPAAQALSEKACDSNLTNIQRAEFQSELRDLDPEYLRPHLTGRISSYFSLSDPSSATFNLGPGRVLNYEQMGTLLSEVDKGLDVIDGHLGPARICLFEGSDPGNAQSSVEEFKEIACNTIDLENIGKARIHRNKLRDRGETLKSDIVDLETLVGITTQENSEAIENGRLKIQDMKRSASNFDKTFKEGEICLFRAQLRQQISSSLNEDNTGFLRKLDGITSCFNLEQGDEVASLAGNVFDSIFGFFDVKSKKDGLTEGDCKVLLKTYSLWASQYDTLNQEVAPQAGGEEIPVYNVNPHNASYFYWMQERAKGRIPEGGLPLVHFDTHTDLGHVHGGEFESLNLKVLPFTVLPQMYNFINSTSTKAEALERLRNSLRGEALSEPQVNRIANYLMTATEEEARDKVEGAIRMSVHQIAQPIVGAAASDVTSDVVLMLPPWSNRVGRSPVGSYGKVQAQDVALFMCSDKDIFMATQGDDPIGAGYLNSNPNGPIASFKYVKNDDTCQRRGGPMSLSAIQANTEGVTGPIGTLKNALPQDKFILDIDLDGLVSNGEEKNKITPISFERTHSPADTTNFEHNSSNETDNNVAVASKEIDLIQERMDYLFNSLEEAKRAGKEPAVITISDSTILERAINGQFDDGQNGGNYTPSCLAFLLNYQVRQKLKELYPNTKFPVEAP